MKQVYIILIFLNLIFLNLSSQVNSKGLTLKASDPELVEKNGIHGWTVKTTLTNNRKDTLFCFITSTNNYFDYLTNSSELYVDSGNSDTTEMVLIAIPPKGKRVINLLIRHTKTEPELIQSQYSIKFRICLGMYRAKNASELKTYYDLRKDKDKLRRIFLVSNAVKTKKIQLNQKIKLK